MRTISENFIKVRSYRLSGLRGLGHIVAGILLCVLDRTNVGSILWVTVGASRRPPSETHLYRV